VCDCCVFCCSCSRPPSRLLLCLSQSMLSSYCSKFRRTSSTPRTVPKPVGATGTRLLGLRCSNVCCLYFGCCGGGCSSSSSLVSSRSLHHFHAHDLMMSLLLSLNVFIALVCDGPLLFFGIGRSLGIHSLLHVSNSDFSLNCKSSHCAAFELQVQSLCCLLPIVVVFLLSLVHNMLTVLPPSPCTVDR
jgi:hypothetical protein